MKKLQILIIGILLCGILIAPVLASSLYLDSYNTSLKLNMHMNGTEGGTIFVDDTGKTVTRYGAVTNTTIKVFGSASGKFNGTKQYLTLEDSNDWNLGANNFTLSGWVNFAAIKVGPNEIVGQWHSSTVSNEGWIFFYENSTKELIFYYSTDGTTLYHLDYSFTPEVDIWYHIVLVRSGNTLHCYVDGVEIGTGQSIPNTIYNSSKLLYIANDEAAAPNAREFVGYIDDLGIWNGVAIPISELHPQITEIQTQLPPIASFTVNTTGGIVPIAVLFTDTSTNIPTSWKWMFANLTHPSGEEFSTLQNPTYVFPVGNHTINLTATNIIGSNTRTM